MFYIWLFCTKCDVGAKKLSEKKEEAKKKKPKKQKQKGGGEACKSITFSNSS